MRETKLNHQSSVRPDELTDEVECLCVAADLLQQMFSALQTLAADNPDLAHVMTSRGGDALGRLSSLHHAVESLSGIDDRLSALRVRRQASTLVSSLAAEIDELMRCAANDLHIGADHGIVSH